MLTNIMLGTLMMVLTTGVHSVFTVVTFFMLKNWLHRLHRVHSLTPLVLITSQQIQ